jgi:hypothetical protein
VPAESGARSKMVLLLYLFLSRGVINFLSSAIVSGAAAGCSGAGAGPGMVIWPLVAAHGGGG